MALKYKNLTRLYIVLGSGHAICTALRLALSSLPASLCVAKKSI